jgi:phosphoribosyl 1,2-cyclic phosphate phosphodiesterase
MHQNKLIFLGTGTSTGVPVLSCRCRTCLSEDFRDKRLRSSVYVEYEGVKFVVDCGPDFRQQLFRQGIEEVDAILFTHGHRDHIGGIDDIRPLNYLQNKVLPMYVDRHVMNEIQRAFPYVFDPGEYTGSPRAEFLPIEPRMNIKGTVVEAFNVWHGKDIIWGFRFGSLAYITDASRIEKSTLDYLKGVKVLVINALRLEPHETHFTLAEALEVIQYIEPEQAYLTHISHFMPPYRELQDLLPPGVTAAYDGLQIEF